MPGPAAQASKDQTASGAAQRRRLPAAHRLRWRCAARGACARRLRRCGSSPAAARRRRSPARGRRRARRHCPRAVPGSVRRCRRCVRWPAASPAGAAPHPGAGSAGARPAAPGAHVRRRTASAQNPPGPAHRRRPAPPRPGRRSGARPWRRRRSSPGRFRSGRATGGRWPARPARGPGGAARHRPTCGPFCQVQSAPRQARRRTRDERCRKPGAHAGGQRRRRLFHQPRHLGDALRGRARPAAGHALRARAVRRRGHRRRRRLLPHGRAPGGDAAAPGPGPGQRPGQPAQREEGALGHRQHRRRTCHAPSGARRAADLRRGRRGAADVRLGAHLGHVARRGPRRRAGGAGGAHAAGAHRHADPAGRHRLERGRCARAGAGRARPRDGGARSRQRCRRGVAPGRARRAAARRRGRARRTRCNWPGASPRAPAAPCSANTTARAWSAAQGAWRRSASPTWWTARWRC